MVGCEGRGWNSMEREDRGAIMKYVDDEKSLSHRHTNSTRALYQSMIKVRTVSKLGYARCNVLPSSVVKIFARM